jgi:hypothetical protein
MSNVEITEDSIIDDRDELLKRVGSSQKDIKDGRVSNFDFESLKKDIDESI